MSVAETVSPSWAQKLATWVGLAIASSVLISFIELQLEAARVAAVLSSPAGAVFAWGQLTVLPLTLGVMVSPVLASLDRPEIARRLPAMSTIVSAAALAVLVGFVHLGASRILDAGRLEFSGEARTMVFWTVVAAALAACLLAPPVGGFVERLLQRVPRVTRLLPPVLLATSAIAALVILAVLIGTLKQQAIVVAAQTLVIATTMVAGRTLVNRIPARWAGVLAAAVVLWAGASYGVPGTARAHALLVTQHSLARYRVNLAVRDSLDRDGDGSVSGWLGGPDCEEGNPGRAPGLREIPGDGVDQDCRGGDAPVRVHPSVATTPADCHIATSSPDVLLIVIDALRADHVTPEITPNLTGLARGSLTFDHAYSPTSTTNTSVPALLSARPLADLVDNVVTSDDLHADQTLPEAFATRGYRTAMFCGLDINVFSTRGFQQHNPYLADLPVPNEKFDLTSTGMLAGVLDWFRSTPGPRFAYVHLSDVHAPYVLDRTDTGELLSEARAYETGVRYVDVRLGHFLAQLQRDSILGHTIIVVTSDHGEELMQRGNHGHGPDVFEESIRVPLIVWVPGCRPRRIARPVSTAWTGPLVGALTGVPVRGKGLFDLDDLPVISEGSVASAAFLWRAVVFQHRKLVVDVPSGGRMLFDLDRDAGETTNAYGSDPAARDALESAYQRWLDTPGHR